MIYDVNVTKYTMSRKKDFVLDRRDGQVADASDFNGESFAGNRVRFQRRSNITQVANGPPLLRN